MQALRQFANRLRPVNRRWLTPPKALVLGFAAIIALGTLLLNLPAAAADGQPIGWLNALFTATSATCVTGLVVVDTATAFSVFGQVVVLALIQLGGVGFVTTAVVISVLIGRRIHLRERLLVQEALGHIRVQGMVRLTLHILAVTLAAEAIGALLLWVRWQAEMGAGQAAWYALFHSVSAFVNAGFDLFGAFDQSSLAGYRADMLVNAVIALLIILGSLGMPVLLEVTEWRQRRRLSLHAYLVLAVSAALLAGGGLLLLLTETAPHSAVGQLPLGERLLTVFFHSASARTGGFSTVPLVQMSGAGWFVLMALMYVGAATASMGGGLKVNVLGTLLAALVSVARGRDEVVVRERTIPSESVYKALALLMGSATFLMLMTILLISVEPAEPLHLLFETVSAFATVGLSLGVTAGLSDWGKLIVIATMFVGRLGPLTLVAALARQHARPVMRFPDETILVG